MTALNDVLAAEEQAKQTIDAAQSAAARAVEEAKIEQKKQLEAEEASLAERAKTSIAEEETRIKKLADSITAEYVEQVQVMKESFESKKESLKSAIKQQFQ